jgi:hypothetical protein
MPDPTAGRKKSPYALLLCEGLNLLVFFKIRFALVLNIVVEGEDDLTGVMYLGSANG